MALFEDQALTKGKRNPWEKLTRERPEHFSAFQTYLSSESRDLADVATAHKLQLSFVQDLAKDNQWLARANAYDGRVLIVPQDVELISSKESTLQEMTQAHLGIAKKAQKVAVTALKVLENYMAEYEFARQAGQDLPPRPYLKPEEIVKLGKFGVDLERLSLGEATSRTETKATDYSGLSEDELQTLQRLLSKTENDE